MVLVVLVVEDVDVELTVLDDVVLLCETMVVS